MDGGAAEGEVTVAAVLRGKVGGFGAIRATSIVTTGDVSIGGTLGVTGAATLLSTLAVTGALTAASLAGMTFRKISSGTTTITNNSTTTLGTFTRQAGEVIHVLAFGVGDSTSLIWTLDKAASADLAIYYQRTTNANEFQVKVASTGTGGDQSLDWIVIGIK